jgi:hypothetical protein
MAPVRRAIVTEERCYFLGALFRGLCDFAARLTHTALRGARTQAQL